MKKLSICAILLLLFVAKVYAFSLAERYDLKDDEIDLQHYYVSEKYDGIRALWDGKTLTTRGGEILAAPAWFVEHLPDSPLDGELWIARNQFEETLSIVMQAEPHRDWQKLRYMVFDTPLPEKTFQQRYQLLLQWHTESKNRYWQVVEQREITSKSQLHEQFRAVVDAGGEGLMLQNKRAVYQDGRSKNLLKLKPYYDAEATVIDYKPGKGKYEGLLGSLKVRTADGVEFYVGSGLSETLRKNPPPVGSRITYKYQGLTKYGKPRFPVFLRVRPSLASPKNK